SIGPTAGSCGTAAFVKKPVIVTDIRTDPLWADYHDAAASFALVACWATPIFAGSGDVLGTFAIYPAVTGPPKPVHLRLVEVATHMARIAIERYLADETLKKRAAELVEADRRKDEFIALLAHELRNPLAPVLMALEIMGLQRNDAATVEKYRA